MHLAPIGITYNKYDEKVLHCKSIDNFVNRKYFYNKILKNDKML